MSALFARTGAGTPQAPGAHRLSLRSLAWPLLLLAIGMGASWLVAQLEHSAGRDSQRLAAQSELEQIRSVLSRELFGTIELAEGIPAVIAVEGDIPEAKFHALASQLLQRSDLVRNVAVAPSNVVRLVHPIAGNERIVGLDLKASPDKWPSVQRMMRERRLVVAGPTRLVEGGTGVIARTPIYTTGPGDEVHYWGSTSTVLDFDRLLARTQLAHASTHLAIAMRGVDGMGERGALFWGDRAVFDAAPVIVDVPLPLGSWQIAAIPRGGWLPWSPWTSPWFLSGSALSAILAALLSRLVHTSEARQREVFDRRAALEALEESERKLRAIFEQAPLGIAVIDSVTGRFLTINQRYCEIAGYTEAEMHARSFQQITHPDDLAADLAGMQAMREGRLRQFRMEKRYLRKDGSTVWVGLTSVSLWGSQEPEPQHLAMVEDITEQKQAAETLDKRYRELAAIHEASQHLAHTLPAGMLSREVIAVLESILAYEHGVVLLIDEASGALEAFAVSARQGGPDAAVADRRHIEPMGLSVGVGVTGWVARHGEPVRLGDARGDPRYLSAYETAVSELCVPLRAHGKVIGVIDVESSQPDAFTEDDERLLATVAAQIGIAIQNTRLRAELEANNRELEQRVAERTAELSLARERAESADRLKSAFLATMSHELRTPLNSIIGFTGMVLQGLAGPVTDEQRKQLTMVRNSGRHLLALISDVLDISKIEAGEFRVSLAPFNARATIERAVEALRPLAATRKLALHADIAPDVGVMESDERRVEQILLNLLNNALKFTERGAVSLHATIESRSLHVAITDTGMGIRPEHMQLLFRPFQQIDSGLSRNHEGTGLGLAICRRLAGLLGGEIRAQSEWGRGSTFTVILPLQAERGLSS